MKRRILLQAWPALLFAPALVTAQSTYPSKPIPVAPPL